jgi:hypothetical protein
MTIDIVAGTNYTPLPKTCLHTLSILNDSIIVVSAETRNEEKASEVKTKQFGTPSSLVCHHQNDNNYSPNKTLQASYDGSPIMVKSCVLALEEVLECLYRCFPLAPTKLINQGSLSQI